MRRIREILLTQYIGAITIGFILAQAVIQFVNAIVQAGTDLWVREHGSTALSVSRYFNWTQFLITMSSVALNLIAGFLLLYWVYSEPKPQAGTEEGKAPGGDPEL
jgi:hypothetical protein